MLVEVNRRKPFLLSKCETVLFVFSLHAVCLELKTFVCASKGLDSLTKEEKQLQESEKSSENVIYGSLYINK